MTELKNPLPCAHGSEIATSEPRPPGSGFRVGLASDITQ